MRKSPSGIIILIIIIVILVALLVLKMTGVLKYDVISDLNSSSDSFMKDIGQEYFNEIKKDDSVVKSLNQLLSK